MSFILTLGISLAIINIVHYFLHKTGKYTIPFIEKIWFRYILRRSYLSKKNYEDNRTAKECDIDTMRYVASIAFWNIFVIMGVIAFPLSIARFISLCIFALLFHAIAVIESFEEEQIKDYYRKYDIDSQAKEYERRNIALANAIVALERENIKLKRASGESLTNKKSLIRSQIRI